MGISEDVYSSQIIDHVSAGGPLCKAHTFSPSSQILRNDSCLLFIGLLVETCADSSYSFFDHHVLGK